MLYCTFVTNIALAGSDDDSRVRTVNYKPNAGVQKQADKLKHARDGTISNAGLCNESVAIVSDGFTLGGNKCGASTIGGGYAVLVLEGASAIFHNNNIDDNEADCASR